MNLTDLRELIDDLSTDPNDEIIQRIYKAFKSDFEDKELIIEGLKVKVIIKKSEVKGFESYPETFVHLITRKSESGKRVFDKRRANRIHWIRPILENRNSPEIIYFEFIENNGASRDYYWYKDEGYIVIMEKIYPNYLIITSFVIDGKKERDYYSKKFNKRKT